MESTDRKEFDGTVQVNIGEGFLMEAGEMTTDTRSEETGAVETKAEKERRLAFEKTIKDMVDEEYQAVFGSFQEELDKMNKEVVQKALDSFPLCTDSSQDTTPAHACCLTMPSSPRLSLEAVSEPDSEAHIEAQVSVLPLTSQTYLSSQTEIMGSFDDGRLDVRRPPSPAMMASTDNLDWPDHQGRVSLLSSRYSPPRKSAKFFGDDPFDTSSFGLSISPQGRMPEVIDMTADDDLFATPAYLKSVSTQHHALKVGSKFGGNNPTKNERPVWRTNDLTLKTATPTRYKYQDYKPPQKSHKSQKHLRKAPPNTPIGSRLPVAVRSAGPADHVVPLNAPTGPRQQRAYSLTDRMSYPAFPSSISYSPRSNQPVFLAPTAQGPSSFRFDDSFHQPKSRNTSSKPLAAVQPLLRQPGDVRLSRKNWGTAEIKRDKAA